MDEKALFVGNRVPIYSDWMTERTEEGRAHLLRLVHERFTTKPRAEVWEVHFDGDPDDKTTLRKIRADENLAMQRENFLYEMNRKEAAESGIQEG